MEERLRQAETLVQVGQLATGIAHEVNNPLASMAACVEGLRRKAKQAAAQGISEIEPFPHYLALLEKEIYRCKRITNQVLSLARAPSTARETVSLASLVDETLSLLAQRMAKERCTVRFAADENAPPIRADEGKIRQLLLNLLLNAVESLDGFPKEISVTLTGEGNSGVRLLIRDTGRGIPPHLRERIMEPFFTTKPPGLGLGLGLSICRDIISEHSGTFTIEEAPEGRGTVVSVVLPVKD
jgi:two-component system NtrC family sensor kinase